MTPVPIHPTRTVAGANVAMSILNSRRRVQCMADGGDRLQVSRALEDGGWGGSASCKF